MAYERKDAHYRRAKAQGYRARSAFKLIELDDRHRLLRPGDAVVDLGAWPGGWMQVAVDRVGPDGLVVGVDLAPIDPLPSAVAITGDVRDAQVMALLKAALDGRRADVLLSDLAPKLTGIRATDDARSAEMSAMALELAPHLLRPGGRVLAKVFMSSEYQGLVAGFRTAFEVVRTTRPESTRRGSAELYLIGIGYRGDSPCG